MGQYIEHHFSLLKKNGQNITSEKNIADTVGESLAAISSSDSYPEPFLLHKQNTERIISNFKSKQMHKYNCPFIKE